MKFKPTLWFAGLLWASSQLSPLHAAGPPSGNVAWQSAAAQTDIDAAFARARSERRPVLLYWGATWCPPCNQLKATLFNRNDFAALAKNLVAVHIDGDRPGAQKLGERFKVSGYPTTVLFSSQGQEITRLPGEVDAPQALAILQLGLAGGRPIKTVLAEALAGKALAADDWRMLAFYSWETDERQLLPKSELPATLARLAHLSSVAVPKPGAAVGAGAVAGAGASTAPVDSEATTRLWLKALAASDDGKGIAPDEALRQRVQRVLADPVQVRQQMDVLSNSAPEIVRALEDELSARRAPLLAAFNTALLPLETDASLSRGDRLQALLARVDLARMASAEVGSQGQAGANPQLPAALLEQVRSHAARADREITDGYERQAVITAAGYMLGRAGLWAESEALLKANLTKSHSPYYLMSQLGSNARKQGKKEEALQWYGQAYEKSEGPATRLQWGTGYLSALVELAPQDAARIEKTAAQLFAEAATDTGTWEGRSGRSLQRASDKLLAWNNAGQHAAVIKRLQLQTQGLCSKLPAASSQRGSCQKLLRSAAATAAAA